MSAEKLCSTKEVAEMGCGIVDGVGWPFLKATTL